MEVEFYKAETSCSNCGHVGMVQIEKGIPMCHGGICPNCGCKTLREHQSSVKWNHPRQDRIWMKSDIK